MFFGEKRAAGIITGKSLAGYRTDEDSFDRPDQPMVRIWLDHVPEGGQPGDDKLTLEVDADLYPRLEVARHGTAVWRGKKLLRFETERPQDASPEQEPPSQEEAEEAAPEGGAAQTAQDADKTESDSMLCPWCRKPMEKKYLCGGGNGVSMVLYDEPPGFLNSLGGGIVLSESTLLRAPCVEAWHCAACMRAVVDCRDGQCDYNQKRPPVSEKLKGALGGVVDRLLQDDERDQ